MQLVSIVLNRILLVIYLAIFACEASEKPLDNSDIHSNEISIEGLEVLDISKRRQIIHILDSLEVPFTELKGTEWKRRKNTYLVILTDASDGDRNLKHSVYGFDLSQSKVKIMASPLFPFDFTFDSYDTIDGFDFARYQISPKEFAFGVRYSRHCVYATGEAWMKGIILFRIKDSTITEIANIPTSYQTNLAGERNEDEDEDEAPVRIIVDETAVILVTKKKTSGYFDLIKRTENGNSVRLAWKEGGYVLQGKDPFPVKEFYIFEGCGP